MSNPDKQPKALDDATKLKVEDETLQDLDAEESDAAQVRGQFCSPLRGRASAA